MWRRRAGREGGSGGCTGVFQAERRKGRGPGRRNGTCKGIEARGEKLRPVGPGTCGCRAHAGAAAFQAGSHCGLGVWQCSPGAREPLQNEPHVPGHSWQRVIHFSFVLLLGVSAGNPAQVSSGTHLSTAGRLCGVGRARGSRSALFQPPSWLLTPRRHCLLGSPGPLLRMLGKPGGTGALAAGLVVQSSWWPGRGSLEWALEAASVGMPVSMFSLSQPVPHYPCCGPGNLDAPKHTFLILSGTGLRGLGGRPSPGTGVLGGAPSVPVLGASAPQAGLGAGLSARR